MNKLQRIFLLLIAFCSLLSLNMLEAQEGLRPLNANLNYVYKNPGLSRLNDSENGAQQQKTSATSIFIPFKDDFSYSTKNIYPDQGRWTDSTVYVNSGFAIAPPSIGVATFDGLNKNGFPYTPNLINPSAPLNADTLSSRPINLAITSAAQVLQPSDSIALTFYYQARGNGESPELNDSLLLDFYKPLQNRWKTNVWYSVGNPGPNTNDTVFKRAFVWISDTSYLRDGFRFRFRNKATTTGDFDHWNVDYIYLDKNRSMKGDTVYNDLAFAYVPTSFLSNYSAMPWQQFHSTDVASKISVKIRNNGPAAVNHTYENRLFNYVPSQIGNYQGGPANLCPFKPSGCSNNAFGYSSYQAHSNPSNTYTFANLIGNSTFTIEHVVALTGSSADFIPANDTVLQFQRFEDYYAFDDGSAEGGYYVNGVGGRMAMKFTLNEPDTIDAVKIYFDPVSSITEAETSFSFNIVVWEAGQSGPGNPKFTEAFNTPRYSTQGYKEVPEFQLKANEKERILAPGVYYVGIVQAVAAGITVGFDKNYDHHNTTYYDSGSGWTQSAIKGSLMIRPVFHRNGITLVGLTENLREEKSSFLAHPNPASGELVICSKPNGQASFTLYDLLGNKVMEEAISQDKQSVSVEQLSNGVYLLVFKNGASAEQTQKIIIQH